MFDILEEAVSYDLDVYDLSRFCGLAPASRMAPVELTEEQLQEIEGRADRWYLSMM